MPSIQKAQDSLKTQRKSKFSSWILVLITGEGNNKISLEYDGHIEAQRWISAHIRAFCLNPVTLSTFFGHYAVFSSLHFTSLHDINPKKLLEKRATEKPAFFWGNDKSIRVKLEKAFNQLLDKHLSFCFESFINSWRTCVLR
jgi:hypothetical protein